ncbi:hypothetical protein ACFUVV_16625 [Streptomyces sp. NPDC057376]|uniref:hypothetical protein n=1 Tax=unclassified Streptomyces TaxID=2593676 RepID=UPI00093FFCA3|nr:hypothetical protein [Streptomyces sp. CB02414]OKI81540.1 hypothetical protein AMK11_25690 [Streptomyces sp. CB02414]
MRDRRFFVLLGPDGAGKSSAMTEIAERWPRWRLLSTDSRFVDAEHALIPELRRGVVRDVLPGLGRTYSMDFLTSLLQTAVVHLRDRVEAQDAHTPVLVDSYYYKILAKCRIFGAPHNPMYTWWRSFPQPAGVVFLDVSPETAWRRSRAGELLNPLEYLGETPEWFSFESYQKSLRKLLLEEVRHLPVTVIDQQPDPARAAEAVMEVISA